MFTPIHVAKRMVDLIQAEDKDVDAFAIDKTWLEPACGNGVFIGEILRRKFERCKCIDDALNVLKSVYAIDIQPDNVQQCRAQALGQFAIFNIELALPAYGFIYKRAYEIVERNIITGDFLKPELISVYDWTCERYVTLAECAVE